MPSLLDELVIALKLDVTQFRQDMRNVENEVKRGSEEVARRTQPLEKAANYAGEAIKRVRNEFLALFGVALSVEGFKRFVDTITNGNMTLGNLSRALGLSAQTLRGWEGAAVSMGGTAEGIDRSLSSLAMGFQQFALTGQSQIIPVLRALGIGFHMAKDGTVDLNQALTSILDRMHEMSPQRRTAIGGLLGLDPDTIRLAQLTHEARQKLIEDMRRMAPTDAQIEASHQFHMSLTQLSYTAQQLGQVILEWLYPSLTSGVQALTKWIAVNKEWLGQKVKETIDTLVPAIVSLANTIQRIVDFMGGWKNATEILFGLWVVSKIAPVISAIASVAGAIGGIGAAAIGAEAAATSLMGLLTRLAPLALPLLLGGDTRQDQGQQDKNAETWRQYLRENPDFLRQHPDFLKKNPTFDPNYHQGGAAGGVMPGGATLTSAGTGGDERQAKVRDNLSKDLGITPAAASGIVSNLMAESGMQGINEKNPRSGRGGFGWAQWTGPRRLAFEAYARARGLNPASDEANYGFLVQELQTTYPGVLAQLRAGNLTAQQAANIVFTGFESGGDPKLEPDRAGHVALANRVAGLPSSRTASIGQMPDPTFGGMVGAGLSAGRMQQTNNSTSTSSTMHIAQVVVHTNATDATGIARGIGSALRKYAMVPQANTGLA